MMDNKSLVSNGMTFSSLQTRSTTFIMAFICRAILGIQVLHEDKSSMQCIKFIGWDVNTSLPITHAMHSQLSNPLRPHECHCWFQRLRTHAHEFLDAESSYLEALESALALLVSVQETETAC